MDGTAIPLVTSDDSSGKFTVNEAALEYLRTLGKSRLAVVACAGTYRTGKSYLLNVLNGSSGVLHPAGSGGAGGGGGGAGVAAAGAAPASFSVGSTVKACTKGIWLCGGQRLEGSEEDVRVLYLDTEGLSSTSRSETFDVRLFSLALLLSSVFLYNSVGTIDGAAISRLGLVAQLTRNIHTKALPVGRSEDSGTDFSSFFPAFVWVVRDMSVKLEREGRRITAREYLEDALKAEPGLSEEQEAKNTIRAMLRNFFPERDCVTLVRPCNDEEALKGLARAPAEALRPEFRAGVEAFAKKVFALCGHRQKALYGRHLNGALLARLVSTYAEALNSGAAPVISSAWERVVDAQCAEALAGGLEAYKAALRAALAAAPVLSEAAVAAAHAAGTAAAHAAFFAAAAILSDAARTPAFMAKLQAALEAEGARFRAANEAASEAASLALLERLLGEEKERAAAAAAAAEAAAAAAAPGAAGGSAAGGGAIAAAERAAAEAGAVAKGATASACSKAFKDALTRVAEAFEGNASVARGPAGARSLAAFLVSRMPALLSEAAQRSDEAQRAHAAALGRAAQECAAALGVARAQEAALGDALAAERRRAEGSLLEAARASGEALEHARSAVSSREGELARLTARFDRLETSAEAAGRRADEAAARAAGELSECRKKLEELQNARLEDKVGLAQAAGRASELEAARAAGERERSELGRRLGEEERASALLVEKLRAAEEGALRQRAETDALLVEARRTAGELVALEKAARESAELQFSQASGALAQAKADVGYMEAERNQLMTLATALKGALERTGTAGKVVPALLASDKSSMLKRLWESL